MPEMICKKEKFEYPPGKYHKLGERFEVEEQHVKILTTTGHASLPENVEVIKRGPGRPRKSV